MSAPRFVPVCEGATIFEVTTFNDISAVRVDMLADLDDTPKHLRAIIFQAIDYFTSDYDLYPEKHFVETARMVNIAKFVDKYLAALKPYYNGKYTHPLLTVPVARVKECESVQYGVHVKYNDRRTRIELRIIKM